MGQPGWNYDKLLWEYENAKKTINQLQAENKDLQENMIRRALNYRKGRIKQLKAALEQKDGLIRMALDELGVPSKDYPAPLANAVDFLNEALKGKIIDVDSANGVVDS